MGRTALSFLSAGILSLASPAFAESSALPVSVSAGSLPDSLASLERQTGIELLFDHDSVSGIQCPAISGTITTEDALRQLLAESNLSVRRAHSGAWIVERPAAPPLAQPDAVVPEILVVGQRTQNADIRRFEDDVQPYTVVTKDDIARAHRDDIDQYFASNITSNTQLIPANASQTGDPRSGINLRGLGTEQTLVLVDGRRMPGLPGSSPNDFAQSDINAIPLHAIQRIEVLTGAAGGIYGFGALGGVVNVVLDRESRGIDVYVSEGITSRGDGHRQSVEARFGKTSSDGSTDFVVFASHSQEDTILVGDRDYAVRDREITYEVAPQYYPFPYGNSVTVQSFASVDPVTGNLILRPNLVFKPAFGGLPLSSDHTYLPIGFSGSASALIASLTQHAGQTDLSLPDREAREDLGSNPRSESLLGNLRHRFGPGLEAYLDAMVLRSSGESLGDAASTSLANGQALLGPGSPANPFNDYVLVYFPIESVNEQVWKHFEDMRYTAGLAAELPFQWRGTAEVSWGAYESGFQFSGGLPGGASSLFLLGDPSDLQTNPLGDWSAFQRAIAAGVGRFTGTSQIRTRFNDQSLRLAGPVFTTAARTATLTLLAEHRAQDAPAYTLYETTTEADGTTTTDNNFNGAHSNATTSVYAELRSQLFAEAAPSALLRGLEVQLALRRDEENDDFAKDYTDPNSPRVHASFTGTQYTAGLKVSPTDWLMLRGSYATGEQPPPLAELLEEPPLMTTEAAPDPKRGGSLLGADGPYTLYYGGSPNLRTLFASTSFLGTVLTPSGKDGPRFALDFSRIRRTRDLFTPSLDEILAHEDLWPERVTRAPLSDADRANGYTAGQVLAIDDRISNGASLEVETLDLHASWPLLILGGRLRLYADATNQIRNVQKAPFETDVNWAGYREGPLKWRANGGFDWSAPRLTLGANLQFFSRYSVDSQQQDLAATNALNEQIQGSRWIPSQSYLDLHATWRLSVPSLSVGDALTVDFGIVNVLDRAPPRESSSVFAGPGYSRYGDPRQRRFDLELSCHF